MRLYKAEFYKLCHKKIFPVGLVCILAFLLLLFLQNVNSTRSTVNGMEYHGYKAIQTDRKITEEFKGVLTDEKLQQITEKYGFPQKVEKYYGLVDSNFLNQFVMTYASDGYIYDWEDYQLATKVLPLADTVLGELRAMTGQDIWFAYYAGWSTYLEWYYTGMLMISVLILCTVSTVFSTEEQAGTKPLLFTTQEGPSKDTCAKIAAAFTLCLSLWLGITLFSLLLYGSVYGWDCLRCLADFVIDFSEPLMPFGMLLTESLLFNLLGILELCAITLCISALCRSTFHSVSAAAICWITPLLALMILHSIYQVLSSSALAHETLYVLGICLFIVNLLIYSAPFYLIHYAIISELDSLSSARMKINPYCIIIAFAVAIAILCMMNAHHKYKKT